MFDKQKNFMASKTLKRPYSSLQPNLPHYSNWRYIITILERVRSPLRSNMWLHTLKFRPPPSNVTKLCMTFNPKQKGTIGGIQYKNNIWHWSSSFCDTCSWFMCTWTTCNKICILRVLYLCSPESYYEFLSRLNRCMVYGALLFAYLYTTCTTNMHTLHTWADQKHCLGHTSPSVVCAHSKTSWNHTNCTSWWAHFHSNTMYKEGRHIHVYFLQKCLWQYNMSKSYYMWTGQTCHQKSNS